MGMGSASRGRKPASDLEVGAPCSCGGTIQRFDSRRNGQHTGGYWIGCNRLCRVVHVKATAKGGNRSQTVFYRGENLPNEVREALTA
jgi:hypothetical protein